MDKARARAPFHDANFMPRASKATDGRGTVVNVEPLSLPSSAASEPHLLLRDSLRWNCIAYGTPNFLGAGGTIKQLVTTFLERVGLLFYKYSCTAQIPSPSSTLVISAYFPRDRRQVFRKRKQIG